MSLFDDFDPQKDPEIDIVDRAFKALCEKFVNVEEETIKHWFKMAHEAGRNYDDLTFDQWWDSFYSSLKQGAEK